MTKKTRPGNEDSSCRCGEEQHSRREFLYQTPCALAAALTAAGFGLSPRTAVAFRGPVATQGTERAYDLPSRDEVVIDKDNDLILVRQSNHVYAFSLACPHENTALRWRQEDLRFQCPRHESKYRPDGTFISGRATRNMDRFAIRMDGQKAMVDLNRLYQSDRQRSEWESAVLVLGS